MNFNNKLTLSLLKKLRLISPELRPIQYAAFKNVATIQTYINGRSINKVVYIGKPGENLFAFYFDNEKNDSLILKTAYSMFLNLVKGNEDDLNDKTIQWGNCEIPKAFEKLKILRK